MNRQPSLDTLLLHYAAGRLGPAESLVVATLLSLNAEARRSVARFEALGGRVIEEEAPASVHESCLEGVLKKIAGSAAPPAPCGKQDFPGVPEPLCAVLKSCANAAAGDWSRGTAGRQTLRVRVCASRHDRLFLMKLAPGSVVPAHRHTGAEITLVLEGSYRDDFGFYKKGDIAIIADDRAVHTLVAGPQGCVCLTLTQGPLQFTGYVMRFVNLFMRV